jgi:hypothetical protein
VWMSSCSLVFEIFPSLPGNNAIIGSPTAIDIDDVVIRTAKSIGKSPNFIQRLNSILARARKRGRRGPPAALIAANVAGFSFSSPQIRTRAWSELTPEPVKILHGHTYPDVSSGFRTSSCRTIRKRSSIRFLQCCSCPMVTEGGAYNGSPWL